MFFLIWSSVFLSSGLPLTPSCASVAGMAHRSQSSSVGENPLDPNYLPPHYREEYRLAIDHLVENGVEGYYEFLQSAGVVDFLGQAEVDYIKGTVHSPQAQQASSGSLLELTYPQADEDGCSSDTYWPLHSDIDAPGLDLGWPLPQHSFVGPTEVTTLVNPSDPEMPSIKDQARRLIKSAQQVRACQNISGAKVLERSEIWGAGHLSE